MRDRTHGEGDRLLQALEPVEAAGDDPDLVERVVGVDRLSKDLAHAAGRAGNDGDFFHIVRLLSEDCVWKSAVNYGDFISIPHKRKQCKCTNAAAGLPRRRGAEESELGAPVVVSILLALAAKLGLLMEIAGIGLAI